MSTTTASLGAGAPPAGLAPRVAEAEPAAPTPIVGAAGNAARTAAAWQTLATTLWGWLRRRVADDATADDLLQTVFLRVHERGGQLRDPDRLDAWVWQVARHTLLDHHRTRRPSVDLEAAAADPALSVAAESPDELAALAAWLAAQIDALPAEQAEALRLTELEGLTMQQAAARLGLSVSGAKSRVQRGRAELRRMLLRCCEVELDRQGAPVDFRRKRLGSGCEGGCAADGGGLAGADGTGGSGAETVRTGREGDDEATSAAVRCAPSC